MRFSKFKIIIGRKYLHYNVQFRLIQSSYLVFRVILLLLLKNTNDFIYQRSCVSDAGDGYIILFYTGLCAHIILYIII